MRCVVVALALLVFPAGAGTAIAQQAGPVSELIRAQTELSGISLLSIDYRHACGVVELPFHHRDPFDRLLASQCVVNELSIVTPDSSFDAYHVERCW